MAMLGVLTSSIPTREHESMEIATGTPISISAVMARNTNKPIIAPDTNKPPYFAVYASV